MKAYVSPDSARSTSAVSRSWPYLGHWSIWPLSRATGRASVRRRGARVDAVVTAGERKARRCAGRETVRARRHVSHCCSVDEGRAGEKERGRRSEGGGGGATHRCPSVWMHAMTSIPLHENAKIVS